MFASRWKPLPSFVNWLASCLQCNVPTLSAAILFGNINHTNLPFELPNDMQQMTCDPVNKTQHLCRVSCQTLMRTACLSGLCRDRLTASWSSSQGVFSSVQTGLCSLQLARDTFDELVDTKTTTKHGVIWEVLCTITTADSELLFSWDQGPEKTACWRPHQGLKRAETSLSPHYAFILSLQFRLEFTLFMLAHGETLWAFKSWGSHINLESTKHPSLCLSVCLRFTLLCTHSGLETKLIKN